MHATCHSDAPTYSPGHYPIKKVRILFMEAAKNQLHRERYDSAGMQRSLAKWICPACQYKRYHKNAKLKLFALTTNRCKFQEISNISKSAKGRLSTLMIHSFKRYAEAIAFLGDEQIGQVARGHLFN